MWNKVEPQKSEPKKAASPSPTPSRTETRRTGERATIGPSISIHGDVSGEEDLLVQGHIEGKIDLKQNHLIVGDSGRVKADMVACTITVEGEVEGTLSAVEQVVLRHTARVKGDITSPRVALEDGARFRGSIDMEVADDLGKKPSPAPVAKPPDTDVKPTAQKARPAASGKG